PDHWHAASYTCHRPTSRSDCKPRHLLLDAYSKITNWFDHAHPGRHTSTDFDPRVMHTSSSQCASRSRHDMQCGRVQFQQVHGHPHSLVTWLPVSDGRGHHYHS